MANSLLDFVISLVRDPEVAAHYAANPGQAIADAHLTGVTSADVDNLVPMVSDSLSMPNPGGAGLGAPVADHGNVWASGAAAAALDAFTPHTPPSVVDTHGPAGGAIIQPSTPGPGDASADPRPLVNSVHDPSVLLTGAQVPDHAADHSVFPANDPGVWDHSVDHPDTVGPDHHGFSIHG
jgi:hypothetical protein